MYRVWLREPIGGRKHGQPNRNFVEGESYNIIDYGNATRILLGYIDGNLVTEHDIPMIQVLQIEKL